MSRTSTLIVLGILIIIVPYSGLPVAFRGLLEIAFGALVLSIGLWLRSKEAKRATLSSPEPMAEPSVPAAHAEEVPPPPHGVSPI